MNGFAPPGVASVWAEAKAQDGRTYFYNSATKQTTWEKPAELMTDNERALVGTPWKAYKTEDGRAYWHNTETKETTWSMPDTVTSNLNALKDSQPPQRPPATSAAWAAGPSFAPQQHQRNFDRDDNQYAIADRRERDREAGYGGDRGAPAFTPANDVLYTNKEDAEAAFAKLLKRIGVQSDWSWLQTVRVGVKDAQWRAIADPKEREDAFRKYCEELRAQDKAKEQGRQAKVRLDFTAMLRSHPEIKHYTRWQTALPLIEGETVYRSARDDSERRALFEEYIVSLKQSHTEQEAESKKTALDELMSLLQTLDLEPFTRWHTAEEKLEKTKEFDTGVFKPLHKMDIIETFGQHIRQLQKDTNDRVQAERRAKYRVERKNREAYAQLLSELQANGKLKAATKWKEIHEYIRDDPRYLGMLGQSGSTPLDLFWDALEQEDGKFRTQRRYALEVLQHEQFEVTTATPFEKFQSVMRTDPRTADLDEQSMHTIFTYILSKVKKREEEERRDSEHQERRAMDDLRSFLKHLEPPISVSDTWEAIRPRIEKSDEFRAVKSDVRREEAFDKYIRRLKDKEKDRERTRRDPRDRERGDRRDREREYRNGDSHRERDRRHRTRTRSPENDPYAAERRQAQQDREARYRNHDSTGLSPPYRRRDDDRFERPRQGSGDHYGRERREREVERERSYVSRADPRERSVSELDYGDSRPVSTRRRRDSNESADRRDSKRARYSPRRDRRSKTPVPAPEPPKEDPGLRSGSEEGEIEED